VTQRYWFARRSQSHVGKPMWFGSFRPITWEGWFCVAGFLALMTLGVGLWTEAGAQGMAGGWMGFVFLTVIGMGLLFVAIRGMGDPDHTAADYKTGKVKNGGAS
jgi:hypothetical protein